MIYIVYDQLRYLLIFDAFQFKDMDRLSITWSG